MRFAKGHGTGNDFVVLPDPDGDLNLDPAWVAAVCDRHRGIGADGVLRVVRAAKDPEGAGMAAAAEWFMDYRNADGSKAEMCGNGVRVFARYLLTSGLASLQPDPAGHVRLSVATRSGAVAVLAGADTIAVDLPVPELGPASTARLGGYEFAGTQVLVGNPHLVCPVTDGLDLDGLDLSDRPDVDPALFPRQANVEFVRPADPLPGMDAHVRMRVYERGVGETLSCGSGACAVAVAVLHAAGRNSGSVAIDVPGGRLTVTAGPDACRLAGPAVIVATGELDPAAFAPAGPVQAGPVQAGSDPAASGRPGAR